MSHPEKITSAQNPKIKNLRKLEKAAERRQENLFVVEGLREVNLAKEAGCLITALYICEDILNPANLDSISSKPETSIYRISKDVYDALAYRESTEGIIATAVP